MQDQPAMQPVTVSMRLEGQQCAMELRVVGCGLAQRKDKKTPMVLTRLPKQALVLNAEALNILAESLL